MEQPRTRPPQNRTRRPAPLPPQAGPRGRGSAERGRDAAGPARRPGRPPSPLVRRLRALPNPRLTGLGGGLFCLGTMALLGGATQFLFDGSLTVYGVLFLLVGALTAMWVRRADLITAPVCAPIAFTAGAVPLADGTGFGARAMGVFTVLALHADWLYGGTLVAALVVAVRKVRLMARRAAAVRARRAAAPARGPRPGRPSRRPAPAATPPRARRSPGPAAPQPDPARPDGPARPARPGPGARPGPSGARPHPSTAGPGPSAAGRAPGPRRRTV
ncbi:DUF6542 domain-containing protein [Streptomyces sp. JNUCC 64]